MISFYHLDDALEAFLSIRIPWVPWAALRSINCRVHGKVYHSCFGANQIQDQFANSVLDFLVKWGALFVSNV